MKKYAENGKQFVLTEHGYNATPDHVKYQRAIGQPVKEFETSVPVSWIEKGYVIEK